ncbi:MAG: ABC transporter ATP-binding protein [Firmicutes bacterium]|nr:ABC transporter ATP-binding protein [Bacillota bacterium]
MSREAILQVRDLVKRFSGFPALDGLSLAVGEGEVLGLVGPNGSGKTTAINVISGLIRPDGGSVQVGGRSASGLAAHQLARLGVNRTYQVPRPFVGLTVRQNVEVAAHYGGRGHAEADVDEVLAFVGLEGEADRPAGSLNSAQQKMLDLARALAARPRLLLVDELGAGLGPADLETVRARLAALAQRGVALVVVEHLMNFLASLTDRVVVMNAGRAIFEGDLTAAARDPQVVQVFLGG